MLALGVAGSAVAGSIGSNGIADNSVASVDVRNNDLRSIDVKDNEIRSRDIRNGSVTLADMAPSATQFILKFHRSGSSANEMLYNAYGLRIDAACTTEFGLNLMTGVIFTSTSNNSIVVKSYRRGDNWASEGSQDDDFDAGDKLIQYFGIPVQGETDVVTEGGVHTRVTWFLWGRADACDFHGRVTVSP